MSRDYTALTQTCKTRKDKRFGTDFQKGNAFPFFVKVNKIKQHFSPTNSLLYSQQTEETKYGFGQIMS